MKRLIHYALIAMLCSCASMNKEECQVADWQAVGYQHGARGQSATAFERYQKACSKHQIGADFVAFKRGHQLGLSDYCTFEQGFGLGKVGQNYNVQCPSSHYLDFEKGYTKGLVSYCTYDMGYNLGQQGGSAESNCTEAAFPDFGEGYVDGYARFEVVQAISSIEESMHLLTHDIELAEDQIAHANSIIVSDASTPATRAQALEDLDQYKNEQRDLAYQYHKLEKKLSRLKSRLQEL